jgi:tetratricopeptide (TPR) repeat protein
MKKMYLTIGMALSIILSSCATTPSPSPNTELCNEGFKAYKKRDWNKAILLFNQAAEAESSNNGRFPPSLCPYQRPLAYAKIGKFEEAIADANILVNVRRPNDGFSYLTRCEVLSRSGAHKEALQDCEAAKNTITNYRSIDRKVIMNNIITTEAAVLIREGRVNEGLKLFDEALNENKYPQFILLKKAETLDEAGINKDALSAYKAALISNENSKNKSREEKVIRTIGDGIGGFLTSAKSPEFDDTTIEFTKQRIAELERLK